MAEVTDENPLNFDYEYKYANSDNNKEELILSTSVSEDTINNAQTVQTKSNGRIVQTPIRYNHLQVKHQHNTDEYTTDNSQIIVTMIEQMNQRTNIKSKIS